jgi:Histone deacetylation protein Rxt3
MYSHHHHRYKEDDTASLRTPAGPVLTKAVTPTDPINSLANAASAHHHHHHHHHHHVPRGVTSVPAPFSLREARTSVNIEPLLKSVADLPRHHLGSTLYAPRIGVPSANASVESQKFGYTSTPVPIPRFEGKENCTFTVRVPRFRIDPSHREEICARRALWGTGVYTDDSDPVAAAIHSGYIRGEWGEDVDISMLDLEIKSDYHHAPQPATDAPAGKPLIPPVPPANKDLHITLLILPRLERYESSLMFGVKSRAWQGTHDGMSYKVERIEWVDEGSTRGEERSGAARRKRLRNMMQTGRICTGPGLVRMRGLGEKDRVVSQAAPMPVS